jgi:hypothetical protein
VLANFIKMGDNAQTIEKEAGEAGKRPTTASSTIDSKMRQLDALIEKFKKEERLTKENTKKIEGLTSSVAGLEETQKTTQEIVLTTSSTVGVIAEELNKLSKMMADMHSRMKGLEVEKTNERTQATAQPLNSTVHLDADYLIGAQARPPKEKKRASVTWGPELNQRNAPNERENRSGTSLEDEALLSMLDTMTELEKDKMDESKRQGKQNQMWDFNPPNLTGGYTRNKSATSPAKRLVGNEENKRQRGKEDYDQFIPQGLGTNYTVRNEQVEEGNQYTQKYGNTTCQNQKWWSSMPEQKRPTTYSHQHTKKNIFPNQLTYRQGSECDTTMGSTNFMRATDLNIKYHGEKHESVREWIRTVTTCCAGMDDEGIIRNAYRTVTGAARRRMDCLLDEQYETGYNWNELREEMRLAFQCLENETEDVLVKQMEDEPAILYMDRANEIWTEHGVDEVTKRTLFRQGINWKTSRLMTMIPDVHSFQTVKQIAMALRDKEKSYRLSEEIRRASRPTQSFRREEMRPYRRRDENERKQEKRQPEERKQKCYGCRDKGLAFEHDWRECPNAKQSRDKRRPVNQANEVLKVKKTASTRINHIEENIETSDDDQTGYQQYGPGSDSESDDQT